MTLENHSIYDLNGKTILRSTHSYAEGGGGIEQYLNDINKTLLSNNNLIIIHICFTKNNNIVEQKIEQIGKGTLVKIIIPEQGINLDAARSNLKNIRPIKDAIINVKKSIYNYMLNFYTIARLFQKLQKIYLKKKHNPLGYDQLQFRNILHDIFETYRINLVIMHVHNIFSVEEYLINETIKRHVPFTIQNHYENNLFNLLSYIENVPYAKAVAGVSNLHVPKYVKNKFYNLSDGIDVDFFKKENAKRMNISFWEPIILLPARIFPGKGHLDLIEVAMYLRKENVKFKIICVGRHVMPELEKKIVRIIETNKLTESILLLDHVSQEELRDWYAESKIVVLPSKSEGLGRALLEAQAMGVPVIAYNVGGVSEAIRNYETGFLVRKGNIKGLAYLIKKLLTNEKKRKQMGEAGREFIEKSFSLTALVQRHESFYKNMMFK